MVATASFPGFHPEALAWLAALNENNNREWFQANKATYEAELKRPLLALCQALNLRIADKYPEYFLDDPAKAPFRIYRDTRFSKNKTPYKNHVSAAFPRRGVTDKAAGFYFQLSATSLGIAGGSYMPPPESLLLIRTAIATRHAEFQRLVRGRKLVRLMGDLQGEQLKRVPKGFDPEHPAANWLRHKQFYFWTELDPQLAASSKLLSELMQHFEVLYPVLRFLDDPVVEAQKAGERRAAFLR